MAYVVANRHGSWEIRESRATPAGPRSRTLATFRVLTAEVLDRAQSRASKPLDSSALRAAALRAGAAVENPAADRAAAELLREHAAGRAPRPALGLLLADALEGPGGQVSDAMRSAAAWAASTPQERGAALHDLLLLADKLPHRRTRRLRFPRISST